MTQNNSETNNLSTQPIALRAIRSGLWILTASYWTVGFGFIANIGMTRLLSPSDYGAFALATFFYSFFQLRNKFSLNYAYAQLPETDEFAPGTYIGVDLFLGLAGILAVLLAVPVLQFFNYSNMVITITLIMATMSLIESTSSVLSATLAKQLNTKPGSTIASIALPLSYLPAFWLAFTANGQWSLVTQYVSAILIAQTAIWIYFWRKLHIHFKFRLQFRFITAKYLITYGGLIGLGTFISAVGGQVDNFLLGSLLGAEPLGYYDRAYRITQWSSLLLSGLFVHSAYYTYSQLQKDVIRLTKSATMLFWIGANIAFPMTIMLLISAPDLLLILYGEQWLPAASILYMLAILAVIRPVWDNATILLTAIGQAKYTIVAAAIQTTTLLILGWPLTVLMAAPGTALATGVSFFVGIAVMYRVIAQKIGLNLIRIFSAPFLAAAATLGTYIILRQIIDIDNILLWIRVLGKSLYSLITFFIFLFLVQPHTTQERFIYLRQIFIRSSQKN